MRIGIDPQSSVVDEYYAVVYAPRRQRDRFPEGNVTIVADRDAALAEAQPAQRRYPARVMGPSRSSEGVRLYYLVQWLDQA